MDRPAVLAANAARVLRDNHNGVMTKAAPGLYPHQWSWDAAFNTVGWASLDLPTAAAELNALFRGQWRNGMVPHIVFDPAATGYFPGPEVWRCAAVSAEAPAGVPTSGICQPPVHAIAASVVHASGDRDHRTRASTHRWLRTLYPKLVAWHRYLVRERRDELTGLIAIVHGWESGTDNSPRWDKPYAQVSGAELGDRVRRDLGHVSDPHQRPTDHDYSRYIRVLEEARCCRYDVRRLRAMGSFIVGDVLFTAIFAAASDALVALGKILGDDERGELRAHAQDARRAVLAHVDPQTGLALDVDLRTGESLRAETIAGFAPLIAGRAPPKLHRQLTDMLLGPRWAGHAAFRWRLPPSTSPACDAFDPRNYWRGPVWPVMSWLLSWSLAREGDRSIAASIRSETLSQLADNSFAEYYEPLTGEPLGSRDQSWTAAVALDWIRGGTDYACGQMPSPSEPVNETSPLATREEETRRDSA